MLEATGGKRVDLVIDQVSGNIFNATQKATAIRGRIVNVGRLGGMSGEFDFNLHALRRIQYLGVTFRTRSRDEVRVIAGRMGEDLWGALEPAGSACRSTASLRSARRRPPRPICAPTPISARSCCGYRSCSNSRVIQNRRLQ